MIAFLKQPWPWWVAGPMITLVMFLLLYFGKRFGVSSTLATTCSAFGGGKISDFFKMDWRDEIWNIVFVIGALLGGFLASQYLMSPAPMHLSPETVKDLQALGISRPGENYLPSDIFNWENLFTLQGFIVMIGGGFLIGFGTRYANGCTSGHAISGLSNLQLPSLIAVIGFFVGGLITTFLLLPWILKL